MSIKEMNRVWEDSKAEKTALLAMLSLADLANESGFAWPKQETIAERARTTRKTVNSIVKERTSAGELAFIARPGKQHVYCLLVGLNEEEQQKRLQAFRGQYPGKLYTCNNISQVPVPETLHLPVLKTSHLPVPKYAQTGTRSINDPLVDPLKDSAGKTDDPQTQPKEDFSKHPAIKAFREETHRYPPKSWYEKIAGAVGENVDKWRGIVNEWVGHGWNPTNVKGMLDVFQNGWQKPSNGSGKSAGMPGTIPAGMEKQNRSDIKELTPEQAAALKASILKQMRETEHANKNAA
jgi:hypothetical protein